MTTESGYFTESLSDKVVSLMAEFTPVSDPAGVKAAGFDG